MNVLLDTHILLWALAKPERLPDKALQYIRLANNVFFSPVNFWEIGTKSSIWSDYNIKHPDQIYATCLKANLREMQIDCADMLNATQLPAIHRDPFERILIAQAHSRCCYLLTVDSKIAQYQMPYILIV